MINLHNTSMKYHKYFNENVCQHDTMFDINYQDYLL